MVVKKGDKSAGVKNAAKGGGRQRASRMSPEQRRLQLLECALSAFAERGLGEASHSDLAERANVSVPTTFHYFPTRESLTGSVIEEVARFLIEDFVEVRIVRPDGPTAKSVGEMLLAFSEAIDLHPDYIRIWLQWSASVQSPVWTEYVAFEKKALRALKVLLLRGQRDGSLHPELDCDVACRVILSCAHMVAHMKFGKSTREDIERAVDSVVYGYLGGYRHSI
ncbi:MAG: TetR family transcriptional regulator [Cellvibrionaceae bacterium]|nr:TetR family transcriptional regulator [Cellvibrionaceae bacterium]|tara:strand:+ start:24165 stop:24833 length:669 start_codon:yes stop_codon:yes gene_type:complete